MPILNIKNESEILKYKKYIQNSKYGRLTQAIEWGEVKPNWKKEIVYKRGYGFLRRA